MAVEVSSAVPTGLTKPARTFIGHVERTARCGTLARDRIAKSANLVHTGAEARIGVGCRGRIGRTHTNDKNRAAVRFDSKGGDTASAGTRNRRFGKGAMKA